MQQLKVGSSLQGGKYKIEKVLGQGGFGITYLATQELLDRKVCIKEFFFKEYCERDEATSQVSLGTQSNHELVERFMNKFLKEARTISQLDHRNIIKIHDIFKENNTAYYVMDYVEGESLNDMVNRRGALPEKEAVAYIERVADALKYIHQQNINHLDIKPSNIMIRQGDYRVILIDFGLSKQYDAQGGQTSTTPVGISHGYAPMEQYKQGGVSTFSPQTDIYALGATLYKLVTGNTPPQAMDILDEGLPSLPSSLSSSVAETIKKSMQPKKAERYVNIKELVGALNTKIDEETVIIQQTIDEKQPEPTSTNENKKSKSSHNIIIICIITLLVGLGILVIPKNNTETVSNDNIKTIKEIYNKAMTYYISKEYAKAIPLFEEAANMDDTDALNQLGYCYTFGVGVDKDEKKAAEFWKKAAIQGDSKAQCHLGYCYLNGTGVPQNTQKAFEYWLMAAEQNFSDAQYNVGYLYYIGEGVEKNLLKAENWLEKAAEHNHEEAENLLEQIKDELY